MIKKFVCLWVFLYLMMASGLGAAESPEAVSPGNEIRAIVIDQVCPTFSWAQVPGASAYQIAVFEMGERYEGLSYYEDQAGLNIPVLVRNIHGTASSWTPSLEEALSNGGRYVWFVQARDAYGSSTWSVGKKFAVRAPMGLTEIKEKMKQELEAKGVKGALVDEAFKDIQSQDMRSKEGGVLKSKIQEEKEGAAQSKVKAQGNKEIRGKENQTAVGTSDFTAGTLGSEGDTNDNVYYGTGAGNSLSSYSFYNSFFGYRAGYSNYYGNSNTFMGYQTGYSNNTGVSNTFLGYNAGYSSTSSYNTFIGDSAGYSNTGSANTFVGYGAGYANTSGTLNVFIGSRSGLSNTTGKYNTYIGYDAGHDNLSGDYNTFIGRRSGYSNTSGDYNSSLGHQAGFSAGGNGNVFLGYNSGYNETGSDKLYIENSTSSSPLIYGEFDNDLVTINGHLSVHEGSYLGLTGNTNQLTVDTTSTRARFKLQADGGGTNTDDFFNFTMRNDYGDVTLSVRDSSAGVWLPMLSYEYLNSKVDFKDNDIVTTGTISSGGGAYTSGGAWIEASSRDYKENIAELGQSESIRALASLNPVRYNYKNKKDEEFLGFIAEDVPDLVAMNGRKGMRAMDVVAVLTKVVQEQQKVNEEQNKLINELKEKIKELEKESQ